MQSLNKTIEPPKEAPPSPKNIPVLKDNAPMYHVAPKEHVYRDIRPLISLPDPPPVPQCMLPKVIYESFTPENTHQMREYMLEITLKNIKRMRKHKLMSEESYQKFGINPDELPQQEIDMESPLIRFKVRKQKLDRMLDKEYLRFDSAIESGNLDRVEAFPLNHKTVEMCRAQNALVVQKYNLFCKVDTNTKGH